MSTCWHSVYTFLIFYCIFTETIINTVSIKSDQSNLESKKETISSSLQNGIFEKREESSIKKGHLESLGKSGNIKSIDLITEFPSPQQFFKNNIIKNRPLLMKGVGKVSPAFSLWTDDYLKSMTPDGPNGIIEAEVGKKETRTDGIEQMSFKQFLNIYNTSDIYMVKGVPSFIKQDVIIPWCIQCDIYTKSFQDAIMWFSSGGTKSVLHHDGYENINCLYRGTKTLIMINTTKYSELEYMIIDIPRGAYSSVDVERVDLDKYPFFAGMEFYKINMEPGDCLYIPYKWLHHVASAGSNLAVNIWWKRLPVDLHFDAGMCSSKFDTSQTLDRFKFEINEYDLPLDDEVSTMYTNTINNLKFIFFSIGKDKVNRMELLEAILSDVPTSIELERAVNEMLDVIFSNSKAYYIDAGALDNISEDNMSILLKTAKNFDYNAKMLNLDMQLTNGKITIIEKDGLKEMDTMPAFLDETKYIDLGDEIHTEL